MKLALLLLLLIPTLPACDEPAPAVLDEKPAIGTLTYALGADLHEVGFAEVRCRRDPPGDRRVEVLANRLVRGPQGEGQQPRVLIARLRDGAVLEAHAFAPNASHEGIDYPMLHMIGAPSRCRYEDGALACNEAEVVPWLGAGAPPRPSFKITFSCPD